MDLAPILISQYLASLDMLEQTITRCPESIWYAEGARNKFWQVAYHALFFMHVYLEDSEEDFTPWIKDRAEYFDIRVPQSGEPYDKETVLEYLAFCRRQVAERVPLLNLDAPTGHGSKTLSTLELQIYSIRHLMQHTGELMDRLTALADEIDWVGRHHG